MFCIINTGPLELNLLKSVLETLSANRSFIFVANAGTVCTDPCTADHTLPPFDT